MCVCVCVCVCVSLCVCRERKREDIHRQRRGNRKIKRKKHVQGLLDDGVAIDGSWMVHCNGAACMIYSAVRAAFGLQQRLSFVLENAYLRLC